MKKFDEIDLSRANVDILDLFTNNVLDIIFQYIIGILQYKNFFCIQVPSILSSDFFALEEQGITVTTMSCGNADNAEFISFMFSSNEEVLPVSHCKEIILDSITSNACSVLSSFIHYINRSINPPIMLSINPVIFNPNVPSFWSPKLKAFFVICLASNINITPTMIISVPNSFIFYSPFI